MLFSSVWRPVCEFILLLSDDEPLKNRELGVLTKWMVTKVRNFQAWLKGRDLDFSERTWPLIFLGNRTESLRRKKNFKSFHHKTKFNFTLAIHFLFGQASMCWLAYIAKASCRSPLAKGLIWVACVGSRKVKKWI